MWGIRFPASQRRGCVSVPKPQRTVQPTSKGVVWTRSYTNTNSLSFSHSQTHTFAFKHTHAQTNHEYARSLFTHIYTLAHANTLSLSHTHTQSLDFLSSQTGTHRVLCARWLVWDGWREALLSTPVFAAVIRGTCYFGAAGVHALSHTHTHAVKNTESALSGAGIQ